MRHDFRQTREDDLISRPGGTGLAAHKPAKPAGLEAITTGSASRYARLGAAAVAAITLPMFADTGGSADAYDFFSGLCDGALFYVNCAAALLDSGYSFASDGYGLISTPNTWTYWVGYVGAAGGETLCGLAMLPSQPR